MMPDHQNPSMARGEYMTIWRPTLRRSEPHPGAPTTRETDLEMGLALVLMGVVIVLTTLVVPAIH
jgi:hypothetical protein